MRKLSKPRGECWNHYQSAKKLEVKLTQRKIRYLREGQRQLSRVIASTYKSLLVVDTKQQCSDTGKLGVAQGFEAQMNASNLCRSPVATGTLPCLQVIHMGVACLNAQLVHSRAGGRPGTYWSSFLLPQSAPTCISDWILCTQLRGPRVLPLREYSTGVPSTRDGMQRPPLALL